MRREDMKYKKMKNKKHSTNENLSSEKDIVQEMPGDYKSRYKGLVSPKEEVVESYYKPTYNSRYD